MFREIPNTRAISEIDNRSERRNRRISAQSSTLNTRFLLGPQPRLSRKLVNFQLPRTGQYSVAVDSDHGRTRRQQRCDVLLQLPEHSGTP